MKKIYISGAISGNEDQAFKLFEQAENELKALGYEVINPMKLNHNHDKSWESYMREDIKALCDCNEIYMLSNWSRSIGAKEERRIALIFKMRVLYQ